GGRRVPDRLDRRRGVRRSGARGPDRPGARGGGAAFPVDGEADLVDADDVAFLPVALRTFLHGVVAVDAPLFHAAGRGVAQGAASLEVLEAVEGGGGVGAELPEGLLLEGVLRAAPLAPGEGVVAEEPDLH